MYGSSAKREAAEPANQLALQERRVRAPKALEMPGPDLKAEEHRTNRRQAERAARQRSQVRAAGLSAVAALERAAEEAAAPQAARMARVELARAAGSQAAAAIAARLRSAVRAAEAQVRAASAVLAQPEAAWPEAGRAGAARPGAERPERLAAAIRLALPERPAALARLAATQAPEGQAAKELRAESSSSRSFRCVLPSAIAASSGCARCCATTKTSAKRLPSCVHSAFRAA